MNPTTPFSGAGCSGVMHNLHIVFQVVNCKIVNKHMYRGKRIAYKIQYALVFRDIHLHQK